ncbi:hypothetical protein GCM10017786_48740 [Amycolatopsis deserti]|uniref:Uncharacterized protein n=1 Tax=Amycolatopsis deserti TaxID=185696 RepID=A0ABQ3JA11_9PSEU|nr:hypothetical protein [Amycolatopsis deserti]GHF09462.1 hypothetical protein GCM10017786_48740 [Amycolatopsis deserti]
MAGISHAAIGYQLGSRDALPTPALIDSFTTHRALWVAQPEAVVQAQRSPSRPRGLGGSVPLALMAGLMLR